MSLVVGVVFIDFDCVEGGGYLGDVIGECGNFGGDFGLGYC